MKQWKRDELITDITDSPLSHYEFLPTFLLDRIDKLEEMYRHQALCFVLKNKDTLTKFHTGIGGGGWIYLEVGQKLWWFISPEGVDELQKNHYSIEKNDFIYFPEH